MFPPTLLSAPISRTPPPARSGCSKAVPSPGPSGREIPARSCPSRIQTPCPTKTSWPGLIGPYSGIFLASLKFRHKENGNAVTPGISQRTKRPHEGPNVKPGAAAGTAKPRAPECVNQSNRSHWLPAPCPVARRGRGSDSVHAHRVTGSVSPTVSAAWHAANHLHRSPA